MFGCILSLVYLSLKIFCTTLATSYLVINIFFTLEITFTNNLLFFGFMKDRILFILLILISFVNPAKAQEDLQDIALYTRSPRDIRSCILGDSVFVFYREAWEGAFVPRCVLYLPGGKMESWNPLPLNFKPAELLTVHSSVDSLYCYYIESSGRKSLLHAMVRDKRTGNTEFSKRSIQLPDKLAGVYVDGDLCFLSLDKATASLHFMQIHNFQIAREVDVPLPANFFKEDVTTIATIVQGNEVQPWQAIAPFKIYCYGDRLVFCKDRFLQSGKVEGTSVCEVDLSNKTIHREYSIDNSSHRTTASFYHNGTLYRVAKKGLLATEFYITAFDSTQRNIADFVVKETVSYHDSIAYLRATDSKRVMNVNVWDAVSNVDKMFISVHPYDGSRVILKIGTHKIFGSMPVFVGLNPVGLAVSSIASAILMSSDKAVASKDLYFYLIGNSQTGFTYWNGKGVVGKSIDAREMFNPKKPFEFKKKVYADSKRFVIGVYQEKEDKYYLRVVKYKKP